MTYCVALALEEGLVCLTDSRSNAGVDQISVYRKLHLFTPSHDRLLMVLTAGNLATTQQVMHWVERDLKANGERHIGRCRHLFEAAEYLGELLREVQQRHGEVLRQSGVNAEASLILAGQVGEEDPNAFMVYPQGNYISASDTTPFLQIGESKYGRPIMARMARRDLSLADGARLALVSMDAVQRSNISVGPPFELAVYRRNRFELDQKLELGLNDEPYRSLAETWQRELQEAFSRLPRFDWE